MVAPTHSQLIDADDRLATVFRHFYCVQQAPDAPAIQQKLLPHYEMMLAFNFGPPISFTVGNQEKRIEQVTILGPLQKMLTYTLPPGTDLIVINFALNGFYRLLGLPIDQLSTTTPDSVIDASRFEELWTQLVETPPLSDRLEILTKYFLDCITPLNDETITLLNSIPYFQNSAIEPVKTLAQEQGISPRSLQLRLRTQFGYSAKEMTRFLRFKQVLMYLQNTTNPADVDWLELVSRFGYYDHSHLSKDFTYYLNVTPRQFLQQLAHGNVCSSKPGRFY
ncbi:helix-turn-helix domain-containing protein [Spirosoma sp. KUDC1026]|uniref:helix-turn-helix domain-containing protein n=1 Tax=Spirosoma sp. KUDC1026 TaxID=2745947 RepID=UPI00159BA8A9|nr:helix-turn-helix domain-containing protein [Spirosoma sp. KUDC1026]QKZ12562.1 AraC family transcriptional regulator [Spirosoma sp. KUDC1026]